MQAGDKRKEASAYAGAMLLKNGHADFYHILGKRWSFQLTGEDKAGAQARGLLPTKTETSREETSSGSFLSGACRRGKSWSAVTTTRSWSTRTVLAVILGAYAVSFLLPVTDAGTPHAMYG